MKCKQCKAILYASLMSRVVELQIRAVDALPNGEGHICHEDAGIFCSAKCLIEYLQAAEI